MIFRTLAAALFASSAMADDRALIIGIDDYSAIAGAPILNGAVADAGRVEAALTDMMGFEPGAITRLTDGAASYDAILSNVIDRLVSETSAGDRVFLYFAGLGTTLPDGSPAIFAHDGDDVLGRIPLTTFTDILGLISDRNVTVVLDTGFDGGPLGTRGLAGGVPKGALAMGDRVTLWTSAKTGQFAWEDIDRGVFTDAWVTGISDVADSDGDSKVTNGELLEHVESALAVWCSAMPACAASGRDLAPGFSGDRSAALTTLAPTETAPPRVEITEPIKIDDGAPASYRETLGFVTDLFAPSNNARLNLAIEGGDTLRVGEFVTFTAAADRPGTLLLLDVDPTGALAQVYPSRLTVADGTRLSPGQPLTIPNAVGTNGRPLRIRVTEPSGQGLLLGLFIEGDLPQLTNLMPAGLAGGPVPNASQSLFEISQSLLNLEANPDSPVAWSATYLPYRIEP